MARVVTINDYLIQARNCCFEYYGTCGDLEDIFDYYYDEEEDLNINDDPREVFATLKQLLAEDFTRGDYYIQDYLSNILWNTEFYKLSSTSFTKYMIADVEKMINTLPNKKDNEYISLAKQYFKEKHYVTAFSYFCDYLCECCAYPTACKYLDNWNWKNLANIMHNRLSKKRENLEYSMKKSSNNLEESHNRIAWKNNNMLRELESLSRHQRRIKY